MNKQEFKRFLSMLLCLLMVIGMFPSTPAYAAAATLNVLGGQVTVEYSGTNAKASVTDDVVTATATATEPSGCSTTYTADTTTLTIKNATTAPATLVFNYMPVLNGGSMTLDEAAVTKGGSFSKALSAGGSVTITLISPESDKPAELTLRNFALVGDGEFSVTIKAPVNGSVTANGNAVTTDTVFKATYAAGIALNAVPAEGYEFAGWVNENNTVILKSASGTFKPTGDVVLTPLFVAKGTAIFGVGSKAFDNLNSAAAEAQKGNEKKIVLLNSGTLDAGQYNIPSGVTLLIPFDEAGTCYKANPEVVNGNPGGQKVFRKLTLAPDAKITVDGEISVSAKYCSGAGGRSMGVTGAYGQIQMENGSEITLNAGSFLYAWGFITGSGIINAESGSTVYEIFQITDFRGGSATMTCNDTNRRHFPLAQYYVQNIEAKISYKPGAKEFGQAAMTAARQTVVASPLFIGEGGLFELRSGTLTKWYDPAEDRLHVSMNGDATLNAVVLTVAGVTADSSKYVLPINNIMMHINGGTLSNPQDVEFLPDSGIEIGSEGALNIGAGGEINLIDRADWGQYVWKNGDSYLAPLVYSPTRGANARTYGNMESALLDVNGTVNVDGILKTSTTGANVISSKGGGTINFNSADQESHVWHYNQNPNTWTEIPVVSAMLKNADGTFTLTENHPAGKSYTYSNETGKWKDPSAADLYKITWKNEDGTVLLEEQVAADTVPEYTGEAPVKAEDENNTYKFAGWTPEIAPATADAEYTAKFEAVPKTATITWKDEDGTVLETDKDVAYGTMPNFNGETPAKASSDPSFRYEFDGWDPKPQVVSGDASYTAKYKQVTNTFTVTWYDEDGRTVLETDTNVPYGTVPSYDGAEPTKASDAEYDYKFSGWTPAVSEVKNNVSYTAVYSKTARSCTITWVNEDGSVLETDENVALGAMPEYNGATPTKQGNAQYSYKFAGWTPEIVPAAGDATYTASYEAEVNKYTVNWYNAEDVLDENDQKILLKSETLPYGAMPAFELENPEKPGDGHYSYEFNGWTPTVAPVSGDINYYASYRQVENAYTVTWLNWDDSVLEEDTGVVWGTVPEYNGETPVREGDAQYSYSFIGWEIQAQTRMAALDPDGNELTKVTENVTYKASFKQTVNEYNITWKNEDGTELAVTAVPYGTVPTYDGIPTKEGDAEFSYSFAGWTPEVVAVTGPASYTASYNQAVNSYTVTWNNYDGTQLAQQTLNYGETPTYNGETPTKPGDAQFSYSFSGWDIAVAPVTGDVTYTAVFTESINEYTVTWQDYNGAVLETATVQYGQMPAFIGTQPSRDPDAHYTYTFSGWTPEIAAVTGNVTYTATYTETTNKYTVTWMDADGSILETDEEVPYDTMPEYNGAEPTKAEDVQYTYTFSGWTPAVDKVKGNISYTAVYGKTLRSYNVTWYAEDGETVLDTAMANYGETPVFAKEAPTKAADAMNTYEFAGWTPEPAAITGDTSYKAVFRAVPIMYTVTWKNEDGSVLLQQQYQASTVPVYEGVPEKQADAQYTYTFAGWTPEIKAVIADAEYTAKFDKTVNTYTVTWTDYNGAVLETDEQVPYGTVPEFNGKEPSREATAAFSYKFTGWAPEITALTGNVTYKAQYEETGRTYTVKWLSEDGKTVLKTDELVPYGTMPHFDGEQPSKEKDELFTYEFAGWEPEVAAVEADAEYRLKFNAIPIMHNAVWVDHNGIELYHTEFQAGTEPEYKGETPARAQDAAYSYVFTGWDKTVDAETGDVKFTAKYENVARQYSVTFQNADGSVIYAQKTVKYGETPVYDASVPEQKAEDVFHRYEFTGWTPELAPVGGEQVYTAQFELIGITGWIKTIDENGVEHMGYAVNGEPYINCWADVPTEIEGESGIVTEDRSYYFDAEGYIVKGIQTVPARNAEPAREGRFIFDEITGIFRSEISGPYTTQRLDENGAPVEGKTDIVWAENGEIVERDGLVKNTSTNEYYYFTGNKAVKAEEPEEFTDYLVENNNSLPLPAGLKYRFDRNGVIIHDVNTSLNGIQAASDDGQLYLFVDGVKIGWGLFEYPQSSGNFYYARTSNGAIIRNRDYWITQLNGYDQTAGIKEGSYHFNEDGIMIIPQPEPEKNGIVAENGSLYYYENGVLSPKGLIKIGNDYYYVRTSNCEVVHGRGYWVTLTNDLLPSGQYNFADDGKMINPPSEPITPPEPPKPPVQKNGIIEEEGKLWYYENNKRTPAGLIQIDGDYYYVRTSTGEVICNRSYWATKTNGLMPQGLYKFGPDGKMIQN